MARKIKIAATVLLLFLSSVTAAFGAFKYFEKQALDKVKNYLEKNEPHKALEIFESWQKRRIHQLVSDYGFMDPLWHYHWGLAALRSGDYKTSAKLFSRVANEATDSRLKSMAYFNQGESQLWQWDAGAFEEAAARYIDALKYDPGMVLAKKRLEWLMKAQLIKGEKAMKGKGDKGMEKGLYGKERGDSEGDKESKEGKPDKGQGRQRRGY